MIVDRSVYFTTNFEGLGLEAFVRTTIDPSLSIMDRGFGVASASLSVNSNILEQDPLSLLNPISKKGVEEEDGSLLKRGGGSERIP